MTDDPNDFPWIDRGDTGYEANGYDPLDDSLKPPPGMQCEADGEADHAAG